MILHAVVKTQLSVQLLVALGLLALKGMCTLQHLPLQA